MKHTGVSRRGLFGWLAAACAVPVVAKLGKAEPKFWREWDTRNVPATKSDHVYDLPGYSAEGLKPNTQYHVRARSINGKTFVEYKTSPFV